MTEADTRALKKVEGGGGAVEVGEGLCRSGGCYPYCTVCVSMTISLRANWHL